MTDTSGIERFFDGVDDFLTKLTRGLNGDKQVAIEKPLRATTVPSTGKVASAAKRKAAQIRGARSNSTALATRRFRIEEVTDATSGAVIFIVTDGATARCEFSSRATAEKILAQLESSP